MTTVVIWRRRRVGNDREERVKNNYPQIIKDNLHLISGVTFPLLGTEPRSRRFPPGHLHAFDRGTATISAIDPETAASPDCIYSLYQSSIKET
jgi:hypothetical protein